MTGELVAAVSALATRSVVGLSGLAGAGKTTLARAVAVSVPGVAVVSGDDFLDPSRCAEITHDWAGLDRARLRSQVLNPFRAGEPVRWQRHDWTAGLAEWHDLPPCQVLIVEGVGLLHPSLSWDLAVWLDVDPEVAVAQGVSRDRDLLGIDTGRAWREVWAPTDQAFVDRYRPDLSADLVLR